MLRLCLIFLLLGIARLSAETPPATVVWSTDLPAALALAKEQHRLVLVHFGGSDWNDLSRLLQTEVFSRKPFIAFAETRLVLVSVDFPRDKPLPPELTAQNAALVAKYSITGYPTMLLLAPSGAELGRTGYLQGGPKTFVRELQRLADLPPMPLKP